MQKQISLKQYFTTVVAASKDLIENFPDDFLHDSSKSAYQLINEIEVYLRSWQLTKKEYDTVTKKTEQLIEEVEKLEIAYENRSNWSDVEQFSEDFKLEFDSVLQEPTWYEKRKTYMSWQEKWTQKVSLFFAHVETPLLLAILIAGWLFWSIWLTQENVILIGSITMLTMMISLFKLLVRMWRVPCILLVSVFAFVINTLFIL